MQPRCQVCCAYLLQLLSLALDMPRKVFMKRRAIFASGLGLDHGQNSVKVEGPESFQPLSQSLPDTVENRAQSKAPVTQQEKA